jgi:hypothetical protein
LLLLVLQAPVVALGPLVWLVRQGLRALLLLLMQGLFLVGLACARISAAGAGALLLLLLLLPLRLLRKLRPATADSAAPAFAASANASAAVVAMVVVAATVPLLLAPLRLLGLLGLRARATNSAGRSKPAWMAMGWP